jgi:hypothetical protein
VTECDRSPPGPRRAPCYVGSEIVRKQLRGAEAPPTPQRCGGRVINHVDHLDYLGNCMRRTSRPTWHGARRGREGFGRARLATSVMRPLDKYRCAVPQSLRCHLWPERSRTRRRRRGLPVTECDRSPPEPRRAPCYVGSEIVRKQLRGGSRSAVNGPHANTHRPNATERVRVGMVRPDRAIPQLAPRRSARARHH